MACHYDAADLGELFRYVNAALEKQLLSQAELFRFARLVFCGRTVPTGNTPESTSTERKRAYNFVRAVRSNLQNKWRQKLLALYPAEPCATPPLIPLPAKPPSLYPAEPCAAPPLIPLPAKPPSPLSLPVVSPPDTATDAHRGLEKLGKPEFLTVRLAVGDCFCELLFAVATQSIRTGRKQIQAEPCPQPSTGHESTCWLVCRRTGAFWHDLDSRCQALACPTGSGGFAVTCDHNPESPGL